MKGYVQWCPREYFQTTLLPVLTVLCPYMLEVSLSNFLVFMVIILQFLQLSFTVKHTYTN